MHFYSSSPAIMRVSVSPAKLESSCLCVAPAPFKVIPRASNSPLSWSSHLPESHIWFLSPKQAQMGSKFTSLGKWRCLLGYTIQLKEIMLLTVGTNPWLTHNLSNLSSPPTGRTSLDGRRPEVPAGGWSAEHSCKAGLGRRWGVMAEGSRCFWQWVQGAFRYSPHGAPWMAEVSELEIISLFLYSFSFNCCWHQGKAEVEISRTKDDWTSELCSDPPLCTAAGHTEQRAN